MLSLLTNSILISRCDCTTTVTHTHTHTCRLGMKMTHFLLMEVEDFQDKKNHMRCITHLDENAPNYALSHTVLLLGVVVHHQLQN